MNAPCKGCTARTVQPNCHTTCEKYLAFVAGREKIREIRRLDHDATTALILGAEKIKREALRRSKSKGL